MNKLYPLENIDDWDDDILKRYPEKSIAVLVGLMIGALHKVWPWQNNLIDSLKETRAVLPHQFIGNPQVDTVILWMSIGFGILFLVKRGKSPLIK